MRSLVASLALALAILFGVDRIVPLALHTGSFETVAIREQGENYVGAFARQIDEIAALWRAGLSRRHRAWSAMSDEKRADELRVFLIGNSVALFAIVPRALERALAREWPERRVSVTSLVLPGIGLPEQGILVQAAIRKHADVIVLTPNLAGLVPVASSRAEYLRTLFDPDAAALKGFDPAERLRRFARSHWALYRDRFELREFALAGVSGLIPRSRTESRLRDAVDSIAQAARSGDVSRLVTTYRRYNALHLVQTPVFSRRLSSDSRVYSQLAGLAERVRGSGATGVAVFMPLNPIFRGSAPEPGFEAYHVEDPYVRATAARSLAIYRSAGLFAVDRTDVLPADAFFDFVHVNSDGMRLFTRDLASVVIEALQRER